MFVDYTVVEIGGGRNPMPGTTFNMDVVSGDTVQAVLNCDCEHWPIDGGAVSRVQSKHTFEHFSGEGVIFDE